MNPGFQLNMPIRNRYQKHVDPEYRRWGRIYSKFPGVEECVRLIRGRKARGAWADIIYYELAEHAKESLDELISVFEQSTSVDVKLIILMAIETAALPESVEFMTKILHTADPRFTPYAERALTAINTKEARMALYEAKSLFESENGS